MATYRPQKNHTRITVHAAPGHVVVSPEPADVRRGERVVWSLHAAGLPPTVRFMFRIRFRDKSPFKDSVYSVEGTTTESGDALVDVDAGSANDPGDYKYDVGLIGNDRPTFEIDPHIVVR